MHFANIWKTLVLASLLLVVGACGSEQNQTVSDGVETESAPLRSNAPVRNEVSNFSQEDPSESIEAAKQLWKTQNITSYTFEIGFEGLGFLEIDVIDAVAVEVRRAGETDSWDDSFLPRTVDAVFDELESVLQRASENPADENGCGGTFYTIRFNTDFGHPTYYDTLGPCDDGVGVTIRVTPT